MRLESNDTIVAISTPPGENGIGIVRLSGPSSLEITDKVFLSKDNKKLSGFKSHTIHYGYLVNGKRRIDEVLVTVMRSPKTYTRQDMVEINCHGGTVVLREALELLVSLGARLAEPGEFTKRAFLSGRIDLIQAEAVLDVISSRTKEGLRLAQRQLEGEISVHIKRIRSKLMDIMADIEAGINFPDEELDMSAAALFKKRLSVMEKEISHLIASSDKGLILREGITTVICGKPNVGKSSLMNSLLQQKRVIVTPIPGTTRDAVEEIINIKGIPLRIVDTAGIIHAEDELTRESVEKSLHYMDTADLILLMLDSSDELNKHDMAIIDRVKDKKTLVIVNKTDLPEMLPINEIKSHLHDKKIIRVSMKNRSGLEELKAAIYDMFWSGEVSRENIMVSNSRHIEALGKALDFVKGALKGVVENQPLEMLSVDIKDAAGALGVITGEVFTEELLNNIFSKFCVGK
jgi:tRNA modification GTPase